VKPGRFRGKSGFLGWHNHCASALARATAKPKGNTHMETLTVPKEIFTARLDSKRIIKRRADETDAEPYAGRVGAEAGTVSKPFRYLSTAEKRIMQLLFPTAARTLREIIDSRPS
jgi:hypothetical protein